LEHIVVASMEEPILAAQMEAPIGAERKEKRQQRWRGVGAGFRGLHGSSTWRSGGGCGGGGAVLAATAAAAADEGSQWRR
jgi:hypothetical protein